MTKAHRRRAVDRAAAHRQAIAHRDDGGAFENGSQRYLRNRRQFAQGVTGKNRGSLGESPAQCYSLKDHYAGRDIILEGNSAVVFLLIGDLAPIPFT